jgi:hypothetical protein
MRSVRSRLERLELAFSIHDARCIVYGGPDNASKIEHAKFLNGVVGDLSDRDLLVYIREFGAATQPMRLINISPVHSR